ncbi:hypothetical protein CIHG_04584 [Coccidioides immitis H538.4]|uniref:Uncharacterized protein n=3 Tax=Coccidioides immitis TaxID=5501 RepID=A0A0J8R5H8_COCIT|nr:hypothetical protein CIRG_06749 [Coccidioides immitis RMSCC 2394]KMU78963.1 hypothetical protein CISG_07606 [Coccidioides immitis RMSCC 3703]KMU86795.1 hypothetical protein CIHG_04584 [Coccidioides immitis H538.4]
MSSSAANQVAGSRTQPLGYLRMKPQHVVDIANAGTADNGVTGIIPCDLRLGIGDHSHSRGLGAYLGLFARRVAAVNTQSKSRLQAASPHEHRSGPTVTASVTSHGWTLS